MTKSNSFYDLLLKVVVSIVALFVSVVAALMWLAVFWLGHQSFTDYVYALAFTASAIYIDWMVYARFLRWRK